MTKLFQQVVHHLEGEEVVVKNYQTKDGAKNLTLKTVGAERWIERVQTRGVLKAIDCITLIYFVLDDFDLMLNLEQRIHIVESWSLQLRESAVSGEVKARDGITLLPLKNVPDGWDWELSIIEAQNFLETRGMTWKLIEVSAHVLNEVREGINNFRFPPELFSSDESSVIEKSKPVEKVIVDTPRGITKTQVLMAFESIVKINLKIALANGQGIYGDSGARTRKGTRGGRHAALWNPVLLAISWEQYKQATLPDLKNAFLKQAILSDWLVDWKDALDKL